MDSGQKSFKLVWRRHHLLSGFLAEGHLPRVSRQLELYRIYLYTGNKRNTGIYRRILNQFKTYMQNIIRRTISEMRYLFSNEKTIMSQAIFNEES